MQKNKWNKEERRITMTEELVTLETAKMLKEKGFNWKCEHTISCDNIIRRYDIPQSMSCCTDRKSTRLNSSHRHTSRMPSSA